MARRKSKYDAACYYDKKLIGRCTTADGQAYAALMEQYSGNATRIMQENAFFSPELKTILQKVAEIQLAQRSKNKHTPTSLFADPQQSPWGEVDDCDILCPGVFMVNTPSHGGIMVSKEVADLLSPAAKKCGFKLGNYICFEEDCQEKVALRELLDKKLWTVPDRIEDKAKFEESINKSIREYNPDYWRARQSGIERVQSRQEQALPLNAER